MFIPQTPEALTPEWLTGTLQTSGTLKYACVTSIESESVTDEHNEKKGHIGLSYHMKLTYDRQEPTAPNSLFVKLSDPSDAEGRAGAYQNEVRFYQELAQKCGLQTPRCFYSDFNPQTGAHILLLEDVSPAWNGALRTGYTPKHAQRAIKALAKFHANWWESVELDALNWLSDGQLDKSETELQEEWDLFIVRVGNRVPESLQQIGADYGRHLHKAYSVHRTSPRTLLHNDFHVENLLFPEGDDASVVVIDWQIPVRGCGSSDVAYNLCSSLNAEDRRAHEMGLLRLYHNTLIANGVQNYSFEDCFYDYSLSMMRLFHIYVVAIAYGFFADDELGWVIEALGSRIDAALTDLRVADLLQDDVTAVA